MLQTNQSNIPMNIFTISHVNSFYPSVDSRWWMVSLGPESSRVESSRWGGCALEMTALICATIVAAVVAFALAVSHAGCWL